MAFSDISLVLYPTILYLCGLIGWRFGRDAWLDYQENGFDQSVSIRLGVVVGFVLASGLNAAIWGAQRWTHALGMEVLAEDLMALALTVSGPVRLMLVVACILHLWAAASGSTEQEKKKTFRRDISWSIAIAVVTLTFLLLAR